MANYKEISKAISHYEWLKDVSNAYSESLNYLVRSKNDIQIVGIEYYCNGDKVEKLEINPHTPFDPEIIICKLQDMIDDIEREINKIVEDYPFIEFD